MSVKTLTVNVTGGAGWSGANIGTPYDKLKISVNSTVGDDQVDVSFNTGTTVHDILGPFGVRPMEKEYDAKHSYKVSFRCASDAVIHVLAEF
jgi:hypothetical protein